MSESLRVGILGVSGYTGAELVRLIAAHPQLRLTWVGARESAGKPLSDVLPALRGLVGLGDLVVAAFSPEDAEAIAQQVDVVFTALPHAHSARAGAALLDAGLQVVDLSADFRLHDAATYELWYGPHPAKELLPRAVYGQPELHRGKLANAQLIAAPGCYPTSAILTLAPLLARGLVHSSPLIIDAKSGVTGAGKTPSPSTHLPEAAEGMRAYKVAGTHRHIPEIEQELSLAAGEPIQVTFTPHLAPMSRGILATSYARRRGNTTAEACRAAAREAFAGGLVSVLNDGQEPDTLHVRGSARAHLAYSLDERTDMIVGRCVIDNLARGASAQAIQALNVARGWPDALGLSQIATFP